MVKLPRTWLKPGSLRCPKCGRILEDEEGPQVPVVTLLYDEPRGDAPIDWIRAGFDQLYACPCGHEEFLMGFGERERKRPVRRIVTGVVFSIKPVNDGTRAR